MSPLESFAITDVAARTHTLEVADQASKKYWNQVRRVLMEKQTEPAVVSAISDFRKTVSGTDAFMDEAHALDQEIPARVTRDHELIAVLTALPAHQEALHREKVNLNGDTKRGPVIRDILSTIDRVKNVLAPLAKSLAEPFLREGMEAKETLIELGAHIRLEMLQQHAPALAEAIGKPARARTQKARKPQGPDLSSVPLNPPVVPAQLVVPEKPLTAEQKSKKNKAVRKQTLLSYREQIALNSIEWVGAVRQGKKAQDTLADLLKNDTNLRAVVERLENELREMLIEDGIEPTIPSVHDKEQEVPAPLKDLLELATKRLKKAQALQFKQWSDDDSFSPELTYVGVWQKFLERYVENETIAQLLVQMEAAEGALYNLVVEHLVLGRDALKKKADRFQKHMTDAGVTAILECIKTYKPARGTFEEHAKPVISAAVLKEYAGLIKAEKQAVKDKDARWRESEKNRKKLKKLKAEQVEEEVDQEKKDDQEDPEAKHDPVFED